MVHFNDASPIGPVDADSNQRRIVKIYIFSNRFHLALSVGTACPLLALAVYKRKSWKVGLAALVLLSP